LSGELPEGWEKNLPTYSPTDSAVASRKLSEIVLQKIHAAIPELVGGSADLTGSNLTRWKEAVDFQPPSLGIGDWSGRYIRYGVREHAMGAISELKLVLIISMRKCYKTSNRHILAHCSLRKFYY